MDQTTPAENLPDLPDIIRATRRGRWLAVSLTLLSIGMVASFVFFVWPLFNISPNATALPKKIAMIKAILVCFASLGAIAGLVVARSGRNILRCGQCPPADAWLWRDTPVKRGLHALWIGRIYVISGLLACILSLCLAMYLLVVLDKFVPQYKLRPGVTVIEPKESFKTQ